MAYTPNADDPSQPTGAIDASTADDEFRTLKAKVALLSSAIITLNPNDKSADLTLSSGLLKATKAANADADGSVRTTFGKSTGKWYWEWKIRTLTGPIYLGVARLDANITNAIGTDANGWAYRTSDGAKINNNATAAYGAVAVANDVFGAMLDCDADTFELKRNDVSMGVMYGAGLVSGLIYPALSIVNVGDVVDFNSRTDLITYSVPLTYSILSTLAGVAGGSGSFFANQYFPTY